MSNVTTKQTAIIDSANVLKQAFNVEDKSITVNSFLVGKVGHKVTRAVVSPTVDTFSYADGSTVLYVLTVTYTNAGHDDIVSVERTT